MNVMVDLETMGTGSSAAIVSIGAVKFTEDSVQSDAFYRVVSLQSALDAGMTLDGSTVMWWLSQTQDARISLQAAPERLHDALLSFKAWCPADAQLWGNGATFDNVILSNAYKLCSITPPWKFYNDRCFRTLKNLYPGITPDERVGTSHHALDDAQYQAQHAVKILRSITQQGAAK